MVAIDRNPMGAVVLHRVPEVAQQATPALLEILHALRGELEQAMPRAFPQRRT